MNLIPSGIFEISGPLELARAGLPVSRPAIARLLVPGRATGVRVTGRVAARRPVRFTGPVTVAPALRGLGVTVLPAAVRPVPIRLVTLRWPVGTSLSILSGIGSVP